MIDSVEEQFGQIAGVEVARYFLNREGVPTQRMANIPGKGHFDIAKAFLGTEGRDLYAQMFTLGFARVLETTEEIHVEAASLTPFQKRYLKNKANGRSVILNSRQFVESKDPRASKIVDTLLGQSVR